jgi:trehalose 6-phosphate synthase/phosphatase
MFGERDEKDYISSQKDFEHVKKSSFKNWLFKFLKDIKNTKLSDENTYYLGVGEGLNFKLMKIHSNFVQLNIEKLIPIYNQSNHRLIFLDYEGTLPSSSIDKNNDDLILKGNQPTEEILNLLSDLTQDKRNQIYIITGRGTYLLNKWFGKIKDLYLAAEHGFVYKLNSGKGNDKWKRMIKHYNNGWINACHEIMNPYIERCEGSFIEIKESSIVWQYSDCDQELGKSFASVITNELECSVKKLNLKIVNGKGYVEVIARGVNKAYFISHIIKDYLNKEIIPDFIMCIGDDTSDEKMFYYLKNKKDLIKNEYSKNLKVITCTVGKKPSSAHYYVNNPKEVCTIIEAFAKNSHSLPSLGSHENVRIKNEFEEIKEN